MKAAETVTFGGSGLKRAAELRGDSRVMAQWLADPNSRAIVLWRGKPLVEETSGAHQLVRLSLSDPVLQGGDASIFLGLEDKGAVFAVDLSAWSPTQQAEDLDSFMDQSQQHHPDLPENQLFHELRAVMSSLSPRDAELAATARALFNWHGSHGFCARCGGASEMVMAGWQRNCPSCGGMHFPRTDPVVIMLITRGNQVLLGRSPGWPEGMYSLLAGFVEPGETLEAAVRREVLEETGVEVGAVRYLASQPWAFPNSLMMGCAGVALSQEITIDPKEIEDARWFPREEIMQAFSGGHPLLRRPREGAIAGFLLRNWLADRLD